MSKRMMLVKIRPSVPLRKLHPLLDVYYIQRKSPHPEYRELMIETSCVNRSHWISVRHRRLDSDQIGIGRSRSTF